MMLTLEEHRKDPAMGRWANEPVTSGRSAHQHGADWSKEVSAEAGSSGGVVKTSCGPESRAGEMQELVDGQRAALP